MKLEKSLEKLMSNQYEYKVAGLDETGKIIVLVDDTKYGGYSLLIDVGQMGPDGKIEIDYDFVSDNVVPISLQEKVVEEVVQNIFAEIQKEIDNEKRRINS